MITVAETDSFQKKIIKLLSIEERHDLIAYLNIQVLVTLFKERVAFESLDGREVIKEKTAVFELFTIFIVK